MPPSVNLLVLANVFCLLVCPTVAYWQHVCGEMLWWRWDPLTFVLKLSKRTKPDPKRFIENLSKKYKTSFKALMFVLLC